METAKTEARLQSVITLRDLLERGQELADEDDITLLTVLDTYIADQEYGLGLVTNTYDSDLQRRTVLRHNLLHNVDLVLESINERANDEPLPSAVVGLCRILFEISFTSFLTIQTIEHEHPELAHEFAGQRAKYNAIREI